MGKCSTEYRKIKVRVLVSHIYITDLLAQFGRAVDSKSMCQRFKSVRGPLRIAQLGRAVGCKPICHKFKSCCGD